MKRSSRLLSLLIAGGTALAASSAVAAPRPVVLELFTSNSCSSCPPAYKLLHRIARSTPDNTQLIRLDQHVDYWNRLDWVDQYSSHAFTQRQRRYASQVFGADRVYTPQLVVDGRREMVGSNAQRVHAAIRQSANAPLQPLALSVDRQGDSLVADIGVDADDLQPPGRLWLAITEDNVVSHVGAGENAGRTLTENGVVRYLTPIATIADPIGTRHDYRHDIRLPDNPSGHPLHVVAFVQQRRDHHITAAASRPSPSTNRPASRHGERVGQP